VTSDTVVLQTENEAETYALGRRLADALTAGMRVGLRGDLGAGKTCLVRGIAEGLGVPGDQIRSPSFTLMLEYLGGRLPVYHLDLFRIQPSAADCLALREFLYGSGVALVEWCERLAEPLEDYLEVTLTFVGPTARRIVAVAHGLGYGPVLDALRKDTKS
jgi:tRNA threonylcarbamoyladenosine biosynthesis protein TsaE